MSDEVQGTNLSDLETTRRKTSLRVSSTDERLWEESSRIYRRVARIKCWTFTFTLESFIPRFGQYFKPKPDIFQTRTERFVCQHLFWWLCRLTSGGSERWARVCRMFRFGEPKFLCGVHALVYRVRPHGDASVFCPIVHMDPINTLLWNLVSGWKNSETPPSGSRLDSESAIAPPLDLEPSTF